jgi:hypothetical protein
MFGVPLLLHNDLNNQTPGATVNRLERLRNPDSRVITTYYFTLVLYSSTMKTAIMNMKKAARTTSSCRTNHTGMSAGTDRGHAHE